MSTTGEKVSAKKVPKGRQTLQSILNLYFLQTVNRKSYNVALPKVHNNGLKGYHFLFLNPQA